jgi:hypothetical protein
MSPASTARADSALEEIDQAQTIGVRHNAVRIAQANVVGRQVTPIV